MKRILDLQPLKEKDLLEWLRNKELPRNGSFNNQTIRYFMHTICSTLDIKPKDIVYFFPHGKALCSKWTTLTEFDMTMVVEDSCMMSIASQNPKARIQFLFTKGVFPDIPDIKKKFEKQLFFCLKGDKSEVWIFSKSTYSSLVSNWIPFVIEPLCLNDRSLSYVTNQHVWKLPDLDAQAIFQNFLSISTCNWMKVVHSVELLKKQVALAANQLLIPDTQAKKYDEFKLLWFAFTMLQYGIQLIKTGTLVHGMGLNTDDKKWHWYLIDCIKQLAPRYLQLLHEFKFVCEKAIFEKHNSRISLAFPNKRFEESYQQYCLELPKEDPVITNPQTTTEATEENNFTFHHMQSPNVVQNVMGFIGDWKTLSSCLQVNKLWNESIRVQSVAHAIAKNLLSPEVVTKWQKDTLQYSGEPYDWHGLISAWMWLGRFQPVYPICNECAKIRPYPEVNIHDLYLSYKLSHSERIVPPCRGKIFVAFCSTHSWVYGKMVPELVESVRRSTKKSYAQYGPSGCALQYKIGNTFNPPPEKNSIQMCYYGYISGTADVTWVRQMQDFKKATF